MLDLDDSIFDSFELFEKDDTVEIAGFRKDLDFYAAKQAAKVCRKANESLEDLFTITDCELAELASEVLDNPTFTEEVRQLWCA